MIAVCLAGALAASVYLVATLEILKLRRRRFRDLVRLRGQAPAPDEVDESVARELETGSFTAVDPDSGRVRAVDPETGEFEALDRR